MHIKHRRYENDWMPSLSDYETSNTYYVWNTAEREQPHAHTTWLPTPHPRLFFALTMATYLLFGTARAMVARDLRNHCHCRHSKSPSISPLPHSLRKMGWSDWVASSLEKKKLRSNTSRDRKLMPSPLDAPPTPWETYELSLSDDPPPYVCRTNVRRHAHRK